MSERVDIHEPIFEICRRLGLEPANVAEIIFHPRDLTATVYETRDGKKFLENGEAVTTTHDFLVST